jgi:hypothetical protein
MYVCVCVCEIIFTFDSSIYLGYENNVIRHQTQLSVQEER